MNFYFSINNGSLTTSGSVTLKFPGLPPLGCSVHKGVPELCPLCYKVSCFTYYGSGIVKYIHYCHSSQLDASQRESKIKKLQYYLDLIITLAD